MYVNGEFVPRSAARVSVFDRRSLTALSSGTADGRDCASFGAASSAASGDQAHMGRLCEGANATVGASA